jgi:two-component system response regulator FlrC
MSHPGARARILVAEDDVLLAQTVVDVLQDEGFQVTLAADGRLALEAFAESGCDALLTDIRMPNMDGLTLIERLRTDNPTLPVVVMSGYAPPNLTTILRRLGAGPIVTLEKPMTMRSLVNAVTKVLADRPCPG